MTTTIRSRLLRRRAMLLAVAFLCMQNQKRLPTHAVGPERSHRCHVCSSTCASALAMCRPLSKTVRFNLLKVIRSAGGDKKGFAGL